MQFTAKAEGVAIGVLAGIDASGRIRVTVPGDETPRRARSAALLKPSHVGRDVVLAFEEGDPSKPVVLGVIQVPEPESGIQAEVDGDRLTIEGRKEVVLRCGKASITLTRVGKVLIRGSYVLSRSSGVNRIKGGSVQIN
ncbi:MAG TPA: DUF6484 domain-containing protein [Planctomycetota bacterium]|nr:DUF6484 domain-containing protein [Planctomycetota bacterium]